MQHKFDMICLSETFLDSSIPLYDGRLHMTAIVKKVVWIFSTKFLPVRSVEFKKLNFCEIFEMSVKKKMQYVVMVSLNRSLSQMQGEL